LKDHKAGFSGMSGFSSKLGHILFLGSFKLRISQSLIITYFGFDFDHVQLNTVRSHDKGD